MSLIFWDTNLFIYLFEDHPQFAPRIIQIRKRMNERNDILCTSSLTLGEVLAGPYATQDEELARRYRAFLGPPNIRVLPFDDRASDRYARIRTDRSISPPDAIQLSCAAEAGVDLFLTNDRRLSRKTVSGIQFVADMSTDLL